MNQSHLFSSGKVLGFGRCAFPLAPKRMAGQRRRFLNLCLLGCFAAVTGSAGAQVTAFNYQGQLQNGGAPANGLFDIQFALYDSVNLSGNLLAGPTNVIVAVSNGLFSAALDFGAGVFTGQAMYLNIGVRASGSHIAYTVLYPRQAFLPTPYAIVAAGANNLLGTLPTTQLRGALLPAQLPGSVLTNGAIGATLIGAFVGNGAGLTNLNLTANGGPFVTASNGTAVNVNLVSGNGMFAFLTASNPPLNSQTAGIQEAINSFATNVGQLVTFSGSPSVNNYTEWGGGRLVLGPGIYACGAGIQVPDAQPYGLTIEGSQYGNTVILLTNNISTPLLYDDSYPSGAPPSGWGQHTFYTWKNVTFATTVNFTNRLVWVGDDGYSKFEDCTFGMW